MNGIAPKYASGEAKRVLIMDDEELLSWCISFELKRLGYEVHLANDLESGRRALGLFEPDLIICDQNFPDGNILDFLESWNKNHKGVEAIIITAYTPPSKADLSKVKAKECLRKPFAISSLIEHIDHHFK